MRHFLLCAIFATAALGLRAQPPAQPAQQPAQQQQAQPPAAQTAPAPATQPQTAPPRLSNAPFQLPDASLTEMIRILAQRLKINYILDPSVKGSVTIYTYGEVRGVDEMQLLETILRMNGFAMVQVEDVYRIVPVKSVSQLPVSPVVNADGKSLPDDERMVLNLIFLKYATAAEVNKLIQPFLGEGGVATVYEPANLLIIQDNARSMKRTMDLIGMFDSDTFAGQRVQLFDVNNSRPSELMKDLESVFKAYALSEKTSSVRFIPVDRINTLIAVAPNPGIFAEVRKWIDKLDVAVKAPAGSESLYQYRMKYGRAETVALAITAVLSGNPMAMVGLANAYNSSIGLGGSGFGGGGGYGYGGGGYGYGGMGGGYGYGGYGGMGGGYGYGGGYPYGGGSYPYGGGGYGYPYGAPPQSTGYSQNPIATTPPVSTAVGNNANPTPTGAAGDMTGAYLGLANMAQGAQTRIPSVIPNPFDNTILVKSTPQEWEQIKNLLRQIDVPPRQVLIEAKIYELDLTGAYSAGLESFLNKKDTGPFGRTIKASGSAAGLNVTAGLLVGHALEALGELNLAAAHHDARIISSPSIIATDSVPAVMNVGQDVPVLTSQGVAGGVSQGGTNVFTNTISNRSTGTTLALSARVNSSGVVTMMIQQDVSSPLSGTSPGGISSPSFSRRSFSTQVTVQDGDTIAIGGFIQEQNSNDANGIPVLSRIPLLGFAFGAKNQTKARTELVVFLTPRVIYDTNQLVDATQEIRDSMKKMQKMMREQ